MVPRNHDRDEETDAEHDDDHAHGPFGPAEALRDDVEHLDQGERRSDICQRPLDELALLQAFKKLVHRGTFPCRLHEV